MTATQTQEQDSSEGLKRMSFGDHLDELRRRLGRSMIAIAVCVFGMIPFKTDTKGQFDVPLPQGVKGTVVIFDPAQSGQITGATIDLP